MITKVCILPSVYIPSPLPPQDKLLVPSVEMEIGNLNQFNMAIHFLLCFWFIFILFDLDLASDLAGSFLKASSLLVFMACSSQVPSLLTVLLLLCFWLSFLLWVFPKCLLFLCLYSFSQLHSLPWRAWFFIIILIREESALCISSYFRSTVSGFWPWISALIMNVS